MEILSTTKYFDREGGHEYEIEINVVRLEQELYDQYMKYSIGVTFSDFDTLSEALECDYQYRKNLLELNRKIANAVGYEYDRQRVFIAESMDEFFTVVHTERVMPPIIDLWDMETPPAAAMWNVEC